MLGANGHESSFVLGTGFVILHSLASKMRKEASIWTMRVLMVMRAVVHVSELSERTWLIVMPSQRT